MDFGKATEVENQSIILITYRVHRPTKTINKYKHK